MADEADDATPPSTDLMRPQRESAGSTSASGVHVRCTPAVSGKYTSGTSCSSAPARAKAVDIAWSAAAEAHRLVADASGARTTRPKKSGMSGMDTRKTTANASNSLDQVPRSTMLRA